MSSEWDELDGDENTESRDSLYLLVNVNGECFDAFGVFTIDIRGALGL